MSLDAKDLKVVGGIGGAVALLILLVQGSSPGNTSSPIPLTAPPAPDPPDPIYGAIPEFQGKSYARDYLRSTLRDFDSLKDLEAGNPTRYTIGEGKKKLSGFLVVFTFNAKNGFGGYSGSRRGMILVKDERITWAGPIE